MPGQTDASVLSYAAASAQRARPRLIIGDAAACNGAGRTIHPISARAHGEAAAAQDVDLRQLRHHTRNTLQRLIALIGELPGLHDSPEGQQIAWELEHRIRLSAAISNALFGVTDMPGSMAERLRQLAGPMVEMMRAADQTIRVGVLVRGTCPGHLRKAVMRTAHELIGNAMKHGLKGRRSGRISIRLVSRNAITSLCVMDDGWGFSGQPTDGEGLTLAHSFAATHGGTLRLVGCEGTMATLELPE